jgi:hypothetical protein
MLIILIIVNLREGPTIRHRNLFAKSSHNLISYVVESDCDVPRERGFYDVDVVEMFAMGSA